MTKRRDLVKMLLKAGFEPDGGTKHEKFTKGSITVKVQRHREIPDASAKKILRDAGLR